MGAERGEGGTIRSIWNMLKGWRSFLTRYTGKCLSCPCHRTFPFFGAHETEPPISCRTMYVVCVRKAPKGFSALTRIDHITSHHAE